MKVYFEKVTKEIDHKFNLYTYMIPKITDDNIKCLKFFLSKRFTSIEFLNIPEKFFGEMFYFKDTEDEDYFILFSSGYVNYNSMMDV